jgi:O-acetyl-ADP-ribose deacetylase (regulator of RNase III)
MVEIKIGDKVLRLVRGDITEMEVEAFVFDITSDCKLGSGYGGAIAQRAGKAVQKELDEIGSLATGEAVITGAGKMDNKHIIHVNGPKFHEPETEAKLRRAVDAALKRAAETGIKQLAFPPIGTGLYQVPLDLCAKVLIGAVIEHLKGETTLDEVLFVALDTREYTPFESVLEKGA